MLVLARKKNESIYIGDNIKIFILDISGETVKIGVEAPRNIDVYRSEVFRAIQQENRQAATTKMNVSDLANLMKNNSPCHTDERGPALIPSPECS
ncbi:MAG: carbon storage regulator CsrA [Bacillota bacterium]